MIDQSHPVTIAALYRFARFADPAALREPLLALCLREGIKGTLLLAREGVNGTVAGTAEGIAAVVAHIRTLPDCDGLEVKYSSAATMPFLRMKVRLKREIVTMGQPDIDPLAGTGHYVEPKDWNALISAPDTVVIDTRNDYEVAVGTFAGAVDPQTQSFREFPEWFRAHRDELMEQGRKPRVAMFCTGGIRCEKSTNYLLQQGVSEVYHLKGGILKYLEEMPQDQSLWEGECYVFDQRVSVGHGLVPGPYDSCHACRRPISPADKARPEYEHGVQCHHCTDEYSEADRARFRERMRQMELAEKRGTRHLGG